MPIVEYTAPDIWTYYGNEPCYVVDYQAEHEWQWFLWIMGKTPRELRELGDRILSPLLLVFKRFDFRAMPRWRAQRWKAKT